MNAYPHYQLMNDTPIGTICIEAIGGNITRIFFENEIRQFNNGGDKTPTVLKDASKQLDEYFNGKRTVFNLPLNPLGGEFFKRVWQTMLSSVPYGTTVSYSELATKLGNKNFARAVGAANNKNPIPIIIPCHRVIGKNGSLTGFRAGIDTKKVLLTLENRYYV